MVLKLISDSKNNNNCLSLAVSDSGLSSAAVAGIVALCVGVAAVVLLLVAAVVIYYRKHQAGQHSEYDIQMELTRLKM